MESYKVSFKRLVTYEQEVHVVVEGASLKDASDKFDNGDYKRFLVVSQIEREAHNNEPTEYSKIN